MKQRGKTIPAVWLRRALQTFFLLLFLYLFIVTAFYPINETGGPVTFFFNIDPLVLVTTWIAAHTVPATLLLALITLAVTLLFGRWFCGWVCPFGVLHNLMTGMRARKMKILMAQGEYTPAQRTKYYILTAFIVCAFLGLNQIGWLDPFSFFYRSLATAVFPAVNWALKEWFTWVYMADPGVGPIRATAVTEPVYEVLRNHFLALEQPVYSGGLFIGVLFAVIVGLNFYRPRFWCRYICPLGALLGVVGKNPLVRVKTDPEACNDCNLCLTDCQGGANPQGEKPWRPSECFYCFNCKDACHTKAVTIEFDIPGKEDSS